MKIGLIAMSGVRACDKELRELGLTLPGFVERGKVIASLPSVGLLTLAGLTPKKYEVEYFEIADLKKLTNIPKNFDMVAISSFSAQIFEAYELAQYYKANLRIPVIMGGLHVSSLPEEAIQYCDSVVIGEGELSWLDMLEDCERHSLKPFYGSLTAEFDMSESPMPAFELLDIERYNRLTVQTSRGCPFRCDFCASSILITRRYKQKPIQKVLNEIDKIKSIWKRPFIEFADDNSFVNRNYWKELLPQIKKRKIKWFTETDISVGADDELLELIRDSGCAEVLIGLESPIKAGLDGIELKSNWKLKQWAKYKEAIRKIQSHGIRVNGCFMIGLDGHGPEIFEEVFDFVEELMLFDVQITVPTPFPGTPLYERCKRDGRLLEERAWDKCTLFDINFKPKGMSSEELRNGFIELGKRLYCREFTSRRRKHFEEICRTSSYQKMGVIS